MKSIKMFRVFVLTPKNPVTMIYEKTGKLIDARIRIQHALENSKKPITNYINEDLAEKANLSARQIERMRRYDGFPEDKSMLKLINAIPDLQSLNCRDFVDRLMLPFSLIERAQQRIKEASAGEKNKITITSGWLPPAGITQEEIAKVTSHNLSQKKFKYEFLYPPVSTYVGSEPSSTVEEKTEQWMFEFRLECQGQYASSISKEARTQGFNQQEVNARKKEFEILTEGGITRKHLDDSQTNFWFLLPSNYTILYNIDKPKDSGFSRYGVFRVNGKLLESSSDILQKNGVDQSLINSHVTGWLYIDSEVFDQISEIYMEINQAENL